MPEIPIRFGWTVAVLLSCLLWSPGSPRTADAQDTQSDQPAQPHAAQPKLPTKVTTVEGITEYRLDNGLQVLLFPDPAASTVTVNLTVLVGSRHEGYGESGMAHLLEHMVFKGTPKHPDVPKALRDHGASFNGTTWYDRTNYFETMPATVENLEFGLALEADRLVNSFIKAEDLASEFSVVRNEFESGENNPERILMQRMIAAAFEWHNYGKSTIGNRADIERVPVENLRAFYRKYYQPDNCVLVVAGKFDPDTALRLTAKYFGPLPRPQRKLDKTYTEEPPQDGERTVTLRRVGKTGAVGAVWHIPAAAHPDYPALEVLAEVLDNEPTGRLYKALVETKKATSAGAGTFGLHDPGVLLAMANVDKPNTGEIQPALEEARELLITTVEATGATGFTAEEVDRAKRKLLKDIELLMTQSGRVGVALSEWAAKGDWRLFFLHRDRLEKVTADDLRRVAEAYLIRNNRTVGVFIPSDKPERAVIPSAPVVADLVKNYEGRAAISEGEAFEPTPANIEARVQRGTILGGKIQLATLPRKTRGEMAIVQLNLRYGNPDSLKGKTLALDMATDLLGRGTTKRTRQQFDDELDKLKARVSFGGQPGLISVSVQVKRENLSAVLELVGEALRNPSFPAEEFDTLKRQSLEQLRKALPEPQALVSNAVQRHLSPYPRDDVRYVQTYEESIADTEALTLEQVKTAWAEQVAPVAGELVLVGDFSPTVVTQVEKFLAGWTTPVNYRRIPRPANLEVSGGKLSIHTPDKANALYVAAHTFAMTDSHPDWPALKIASFVFGEAALASRVSNRVRGKEGLSYGAGGRVSVSPIDEAGTFMLFAIANPVNIPKVEDAIADELSKMLEGGLTQKELDDAKRAYLEQLKTSRGSDSAIAGALANGLFLGRTMHFDADFERRIEALTVEQVNAAFRRHIKPNRLFIAVGGDFKKAESDVTPKPATKNVNTNNVTPMKD